MKKAFNFLVLSVFFLCSSQLFAATVNFPTDQPVIQSIEQWARKVRYNTHLFYERMQTLLTLKEKNSNFWNLEALYLEGWYDCPAPEEVSLIKVVPDNPDYFGHFTDTAAIVTGTVGTTGALAYGYSYILDLYLATLWHLRERELAVGDLFTVREFGSTTCRYEILGINDENVDYSIIITDCFCTMHGVGFWNRKNGMVGQFYVEGYGVHEIHFSFSSSPQE